MRTCILKNQNHCFLRVISSPWLLKEKSEASHTLGNLRMEERFILSDSRDARKPQKLKVKLGPLSFQGTKLWGRSPIYFFCYFESTTDPSLSHGRECQRTVAPEDGGKEPYIIHNLVSVRPALCPQISSGLGTFVFLSAKVSWEPSKAIVTGSSLDYSSISGRGKRIASYLNTEPPAPQFFTPRAPIVLHSNLIMPEFYLQSFHVLFIVHKRN